MICFQIWSFGWPNSSNILKFSLKNILNCNVDSSIVYVNN